MGKLPDYVGKPLVHLEVRMPFVRTTDSTTHETHGARFTTHANPTLGSTELCVWQLCIPAGVVRR
jgi:hypothetical protein